MINTHKDIVAFHNDKVNLSKPQTVSIRSKRDANRNKLLAVLQPRCRAKISIVSQGSYQMRTMVQAPNNDYDIDDGVYFTKSDLGNMSALDTRNMVCAAVRDPGLATQPIAKKNCVRVQYNDGSHIDIPAYRTEDNGTRPMLASADWIRSDARDVTAWFKGEYMRKSPDGEQLRKVVRLVKFFARSRPGWKDRMLSGFGITVLACECYVADTGRDDRALYNTMVNMANRLRKSQQIIHPVTVGVPITNHGDAKAINFANELVDKLQHLAPLLDANCGHAKAMSCWKIFFSNDFFDGLCASQTNKTFGSKTVSNAGVGTTGATTVKRGGTGGYA